MFFIWLSVHSGDHWKITELYINLCFLLFLH
jgi:hypothetical protein